MVAVAAAPAVPFILEGVGWLMAGIASYFLGKEAVDAVNALEQPTADQKPQKDPDKDPLPVPAPPYTRLENKRKEDDQDKCCRPDRFQTLWPKGSKTMVNHIKPEIGWNDWNKGGHLVVFQRGWRYQQQTCGSIEYRCVDEGETVGSRAQWADGLLPGQCWMAEAKYVMPNNTSLRPELIRDVTNRRRKRTLKQFEKYGVVSKNPRKTDPPSVCDFVGLRVYVSEAAGPMLYFWELLKKFNIHGDVLYVPARTGDASHSDPGRFEDRDALNDLDVDDI